MLITAGNYASLQQIAVEFDVISGETRGKCTKVLDRAYLSIMFSPVSAQIMRQDAVCIQKNYIRPPYNTSLPYKNDFACTNVHLKLNYLRQTTLFNLFSGG